MRKDKQNDIEHIKQLFREMTTRQKLAYLWDYYKIHLAMLIFALTIIISIAHTVHTNIEMQDYLHVVLQDTCQTELQPLLEDAVRQAGYGEEVVFLTSHDLDADPTGTEWLQLVAYIAAGEMDIGILDADTVRYLKESDAAEESFLIVPLEETSLNFESEETDYFLLISKNTERISRTESISTILLPE